MKAINEIGNKYGKLTVIERGPNQGKKACWICQCDCGEIVIARADLLRSGQIVRCKKCRRDNLKDETGNKYDKLTVLGLAPKRNDVKTSGAYWICQCDCGEILQVLGTNLRSRKKQSCRYCAHKISKVGQRYGLLTIIQELPNNNYKCLCDCGNEIILSSKTLSVEHRKSCGCIKSYGEQKIMGILKENNISYYQQFKFDDCIYPITNHYLYFDFYLPQQNILIEYDGEYHFKEWRIKNRASLEETQKRDNFKNQWCKDNNIPLIRIPYWHLKNICLEDLLLETSQFLI